MRAPDFSIVVRTQRSRFEFVAFRADTKAFQEAQVSSCERTVNGRFRLSSFVLTVDLVETDGGFQHQDDVKALLANLANNFGDVF